MEPSDTELADWVFDCAIEFLQSPQWTVPVEGFIEKHSSAFDASEEENKLEFTALHSQFREMCDGLLTSYLEELGVQPEQFIAAARSGVNPELSSLVTDFLVSMDDFSAFRRMMEKRNVEEELEVMAQCAEYAGLRPEDIYEMDDEERFLYEMAVRISIGEDDLMLKRLEKEDAEIMYQLAKRIALAHEATVKEQLNDSTATPDTASDATGENLDVAVQQIQQDCHRQRIENLQKALTAEGKVSPADAPALQPAWLQKKPLPPILSSSASAAPVDAPPDAVQPTFKQLCETQSVGKAAKAENVPDQPKGTHNQQQPSAEEIASREAYFKAQRDRLRQLKLNALQASAPQKAPTGHCSSTSAQPTGGCVNENALSSEEKAMRLQLAQRFREDLIQETRKTAAH